MLKIIYNNMVYQYKNTQINYKLIGNGNKLAVFLHGWGANSDLILPLAKNFTNNFTCLLIDFPPFLPSSEPKTVWTMQDYKNLTENIIKLVLNNLNLLSVDIIIGHSFGGRVSIMLASDNNLNINKLVLLSAAGIKPKRTIGYKIRVFKYKLLKKLNSKKIHNMGSSDYKQLSVNMKATFINIVNEDLTHLCNKISARTLIIFGSKDKETPLYMAKKLNKNIKQSQLLIIKNAGHFAYLEYSNFVINQIKSFLNS